MNPIDKATYIYIKHIKRWMECPICHERMFFFKGISSWVCKSCDYTLSETEFLNDYVFWFCDACGTYLNIQEGFDRESKTWKCAKCGFSNDITFSNLKGMCKDCGQLLDNPNGAICTNCKQIRQRKTQERLKSVGKVIGVAAAVAGAICIADKSTGEDSAEYTSFPSESDEGGLLVDKNWLKSASEDELKAKKSKIQFETDWRSGSILDGDFDAEIEALDTIDNEINERAWAQYNSEDHSNESYGVHREHGWYLPNDD